MVQRDQSFIPQLLSRDRPFLSLTGVGLVSYVIGLVTWVLSMDHTKHNKEALDLIRSCGSALVLGSTLIGVCGAALLQGKRKDWWGYYEESVIRPIYIVATAF
jgi:cytochrome bd-type quinol oxidase subunit 2